jgi:NAD(P)H-dependent FMN reductase
MLKIKVILGSTRQGRFGDEVAKWVMGQLAGRTDIAAELLDLRDYPMPFFNESMSPSMITAPYADPMVQKWTAKIAEGDAFIMLTPEYNHSFSAVLKNAIDYVGKEWNRKPVAFVGWGGVGGARAVEHLRGVAAELQMVSIRSAVHIAMPWMLPKDETTGALKADALESHNDTMKMMTDQLVWWGNALKTARDAEAGK